MPSVRLKFNETEVPSVKELFSGLNGQIVDVTSIRIQLSNPFTGDNAIGGFTFPRLRVTLQYLGDAVLSPGDSGFVDEVDLIANQTLYKPATFTVDTQMNTWNQHSIPGNEGFVLPFYIGCDVQGNMPGTFVVDVTVFYSVRIGTELERTALAVMVSRM